jgi:hypothetical protein
MIVQAWLWTRRARNHAEGRVGWRATRVAQPYYLLAVREDYHAWRGGQGKTTPGTSLTQNLIIVG